MLEFELISSICSKMKILSSDVVVACGDDAAVIRVGGVYRFITTDSLAADTHYRVEWKEKIGDLYYYLGRKLLSISLSDVASMGGVPEFAVVNFGLTKCLNFSDIDALSDGLADCANDNGVSIVGGDTVRSAGEFFSLSLVGRSIVPRYMLRSSARPGDLVGITGMTGGASVGLRILNGDANDLKDYVLKFLNPVPRIQEGVELVKMGVKCCTDISDGLVLSAHNIAVSSGVSLKFYRGVLMDFAGRDIGFDDVLYGGEDYELLFTFPEAFLDDVEKLGFLVIGTVCEGEGVFIDDDRLPCKGFDHFGVYG